MASTSKHDGPALVPLGKHLGKPPIPFTRAVTLVGSRHNARLHLLSRSVSKAHALIVQSHGWFYVRDLASRNGVFVNGTRIREHDLRDGDELDIGSFKFRYVAGGRGRKPIPPAPAQLEVAGAPVALPIDERVVLIGRRPSCDIPLLEDSVSTAHAVVFESNGRHYVRDLGSRTGTRVNGKPVHQHELEFGEVIEVGETTITYARLPAAEVEELALEAVSAPILPVVAPPSIEIEVLDRVAAPEPMELASHVSSDAPESAEAGLVHDTTGPTGDIEPLRLEPLEPQLEPTGAGHRFETDVPLHIPLAEPGLVSDPSPAPQSEGPAGVDELELLPTETDHTPAAEPEVLEPHISVNQAAPTDWDNAATDASEGTPVDEIGESELSRRGWRSTLPDLPDEPLALERLGPTPDEPLPPPAMPMVSAEDDLTDLGLTGQLNEVVPSLELPISPEVPSLPGLPESVEPPALLTGPEEAAPAEITDAANWTGEFHDPAAAVGHAPVEATEPADLDRYPEPELLDAPAAEPLDLGELARVLDEVEPGASPAPEWSPQPPPAEAESLSDTMLGRELVELSPDPSELTPELTDVTADQPEGRLEPLASAPEPPLLSLEPAPTTADAPESFPVQTESLPEPADPVAEALPVEAPPVEAPAIEAPPVELTEAGAAPLPSEAVAEHAGTEPPGVDEIQLEIVAESPVPSPDVYAAPLIPAAELNEMSAELTSDLAPALAEHEGEHTKADPVASSQGPAPLDTPAVPVLGANLEHFLGGVPLPLDEPVRSPFGDVAVDFHDEPADSTAVPPLELEPPHITATPLTIELPIIPESSAAEPTETVPEPPENVAESVDHTPEPLPVAPEVRDEAPDNAIYAQEPPGELAGGPAAEPIDVVPDVPESSAEVVPELLQAESEALTERVPAKQESSEALTLTESLRLEEQSAEPEPPPMPQASPLTISLPIVETTATIEPEPVAAQPDTPESPVFEPAVADVESPEVEQAGHGAAPSGQGIEISTPPEPALVDLTVVEPPPQAISEEAVSVDGVEPAALANGLGVTLPEVVELAPNAGDVDQVVEAAEAGTPLESLISDSALGTRELVDESVAETPAPEPVLPVHDSLAEIAGGDDELVDGPAAPAAVAEPVAESFPTSLADFKSSVAVPYGSSRTAPDPFSQPPPGVGTPQAERPEASPDGEVRRRRPVRPLSPLPALEPPRPSPASPSRRRRIDPAESRRRKLRRLPALLSLMLLSLGLGFGAVWMLFPVRHTFEATVRIAQFDQLSIAAQRLLQADQTREVQSDRTRLFARKVFEQNHPGVKPGILDDAVGYQKPAIQVVWPESSDRRGQMILRYQGTDSKHDADRLRAVVTAFHNSDLNARLRREAAGHRNALEQLTASIDRASRRLGELKEETERLRQIGENRPTSSQIAAAEEEVRKLEQEWRRHAGEVKSAEAELTILKLETEEAAPGGARPELAADDPEIAELAARLDAERAAAEARRRELGTRAAEARRRLDEATEQVERQLARTRELVGDNPELQRYVNAAQGLMETTRRLVEEQRRRQDQHLARLNELQQQLDVAAEERRGEKLATDPQLRELKARLEMATRRHNAAIAGGLEAESTQYGAEIAEIRDQIRVRTIELSSGDAVAGAQDRVRQYIEATRRDMEEDRRQTDATLASLQSQFAAGAGVERLPQEQRELAADLEKRLGELNQARAEYAAIDEAGLLPDEDDLQKIARLEQELKTRQREVAERKAREEQITREKQREGALVAVQERLNRARELEIAARDAFFDKSKFLEQLQSQLAEARIAGERLERAIGERDTARRQLEILQGQLSIKQRNVNESVEPIEMAEQDVRMIEGRDHRLAISSAVCGAILLVFLSLIAMTLHGAAKDAAKMREMGLPEADEARDETEPLVA
jgi:pSer/pThr/pTyr-binding forkhead associated (FHA) protein